MLSSKEIKQLETILNSHSTCNYNAKQVRDFGTQLIQLTGAIVNIELNNLVKNNENLYEKPTKAEKKNTI